MGNVGRESSLVSALPPSTMVGMSSKAPTGQCRHMNATAPTIAVSRKSRAVAIILAVLFGPIGMFYFTTRGAALMLLLYLIAGLSVGPIAWVATWPICVCWAALASDRPSAGPVENAEIAICSKCGLQEELVDTICNECFKRHLFALVFLVIPIFTSLLWSALGMLGVLAERGSARYLNMAATACMVLRGASLIALLNWKKWGFYTVCLSSLLLIVTLAVREELVTTNTVQRFGDPLGFMVAPILSGNLIFPIWVFLLLKLSPSIWVRLR